MEQSIIALLQSSDEDVRLSNLSNGRVLIWYQNQWMVKDTSVKRQWRRSLVVTQDLQLALKWLRGEVNGQS